MSVIKPRYEVLQRAVIVLTCGYGSHKIKEVFIAVGRLNFGSPTWAVQADQQFVAQLLYNKNITVVGGLLTLAAWGAGAWGFDGRRRV